MRAVRSRGRRGAAAAKMALIRFAKSPKGYIAEFGTSLGILPFSGLNFVQINPMSSVIEFHDHRRVGATGEHAQRCGACIERGPSGREYVLFRHLHLERGRHSAALRVDASLLGTCRSSIRHSRFSREQRGRRVVDFGFPKRRRQGGLVHVPPRRIAPESAYEDGIEGRNNRFQNARRASSERRLRCFQL
jgi:hypothetical protein